MENVFQIGGAVSGNSFIGRRKMLEKFRFDYLKSKNRVGRSIVGITRIGKTSFINEIFNEVEDNILVIIHDLKLSESYYGLWKKICLRIEKYLKKNNSGEKYLLDLIREVTNNPELDWVEFEENIVDIFDELKGIGVRTILVLDEFDYAEWLFEGKTHHFELFRTIFADLKVSSILVSRRPLHIIEKTTYQSSTFHGVLDPVYFKGFDDKDMEEYYNSFTNVGLELNAIKKQEIEYYAGRMPFLLSVLGHYILDEFDKNGDIDITKIYHGKCKAINDYYRDCIKHLTRDDDIKRIVPFVLGPNIGVNQNDKDELVSIGYLALKGEKMIAISEYFTQFLSVNMLNLNLWDAIIGVEKALKQIIEREMPALIDTYQVYGSSVKELERKIIQKTPGASSISLYDTFISDTEKKFLQKCTYFDVMSLKDSTKIILYAWTIFAKYFNNDEAEGWKYKFSKCGIARNPVAHGHEEYVTDIEKKEVDAYCKEILNAIAKVPIDNQGELLSEEKLLEKATTYSTILEVLESLNSGEYVFYGEEVGANKNLKGTIISEGEHKDEKGSISKSSLEAISRTAWELKNKRIVVTIKERNPQNNGFILQFVREL